MGALLSTGLYGTATKAVASIYFADYGRQCAQDVMSWFDQASSFANGVFPDSDVAARLGWDYPTQTAQIELNGARVRVNAALDEFEDVPGGDAIPPPADRHLMDALQAGWDLVLKIDNKGDVAPSATDRVLAGAKEVGADVGDVLSGPLLEFLNKVVENLWFWLALVGVIVYLVKFKGGRLGAVAAAVV